MILCGKRFILYFLEWTHPLKIKVIYEIEPNVLVKETERQLDRSRNAISHVGFTEEWAKSNGKIVYKAKE